ncbi:aminotransferase class V-fold PLP-dependent enzyme [Lujinxingia vulgaris]|uniref:Aminotransferase class V-fold PLP-dependent enzyme n=1 Tax=Lujinxingia vulgaris TaxID=2600176 RepID=A0A5C6WW60_9DELT|nr:aminotransferase class V-fold PLP-dependent enzyme [Lujinxingia vulgaris]TXD33497.1 aminotransferase class V-fold PLP-dependent enzyme [Lujinxingia vulgaris]
MSEKSDANIDAETTAESSATHAPLKIDYAPHWGLDSGVIHLNHGSFGACPRRVLHAQDALRRQLEANPVRFVGRELPGLMAHARAELANFVGADAPNLVFVPNTTTGVNAVLGSLDLQPGDEILVTSQGYGPCTLAARTIAAQKGARVISAELPFHPTSADALHDALIAAVTQKTRIALFDHVTSPTALILPAARIAKSLRERGVLSLIDGAHAPGMIPLDLNTIGADFYVGNCHKWLCSPRGAAFLHVTPEHQATTRPPVFSHAAGMADDDPQRFQAEFGWMGTYDVTSYLSVPAAIDFLRALVPGGWPALMARNRRMALVGRDLVCEVLGIVPPAPDDLLGSMAALPLPDRSGPPINFPLEVDPLQQALFEQAGIEIAVMTWPAHPHRLLRLSCQLYTTENDLQTLADALASLI